MSKSSKSNKARKSREQHHAWIEARVANYVNTRSPYALARMVVEAEESGGILPEFEIDEEWPEYVEHMRVK